MKSHKSLLSSTYCKRRHLASVIRDSRLLKFTETEIADKNMHLHPLNHSQQTVTRWGLHWSASCWPWFSFMMPCNWNSYKKIQKYYLWCQITAYALHGRGFSTQPHENTFLDNLVTTPLHAFMFIKGMQTLGCEGELQGDVCSKRCAVLMLRPVTQRSHENYQVFKLSSVSQQFANC